MSNKPQSQQSSHQIEGQGASQAQDAAPRSASFPTLDAVLSQYESKTQIAATSETLIAFLRKRIDLLDKGKAQLSTTLLKAEINAEIAKIDDFVADSLDHVLHHPSFQRVEASWTGLRTLVSKLEDDPERLVFRLINITRKELDADLVGTPRLEQTALFNMIHEKGFGRYGAMPFGAMLADFDFSNSAEDVETLKKLGELGAVAHMPVIASANPEMFGLKKFSDFVEGVGTLPTIMSGNNWSDWRSFREHPNSRYVALTLPRILIRRPYTSRLASKNRAALQEGGRIDGVPAGFEYVERVAARDHSHLLWGSPVWAYGEVLTRSFAQFGWCSQIQGVEGGGQVVLPTHVYAESKDLMAGPCEVGLPDSRETELSEMGFIALISEEGKPKAVFLGGQSCQKPKQYYENEATASAELAAEIPNVFAASRFAHCIKIMLIRKIGQFASAAACKAHFEEWIKNFVLKTTDAAPELMAKKPLNKAEINVQDLPGKPGHFIVTAWVRPHIRMKKADISLRLVSELPKDIKKSE